MVSHTVISNAPKACVRVTVRAAIALVIAAAAMQLSSCASPAYYWQAASGHFALMRARQDVIEAIEQGSADEDTLEKLRLSRDIKTFAVTELDLPDTDSYSDFVRTGRDAVVWNVVAAPEFSLEAKTWCFPVSGCVPYRGYFDRGAAQDFAERLAERDLDVAISPAIAYSTLGWFDDPLLDTMWRQSEAQFAAYLFHEMAHQKLYVKGDAKFNESYASFVEAIGVERWLEQRNDGEALENWRTLSEARSAFNMLVHQSRAELAEIYASSAASEAMREDKQAAFDRLQTRYHRLRQDQWNGRDYFGGWFDRELNNARFALFDSYEGGHCAFDRLYDEAGEDIERFHDLARVKSRLPADGRRRWLTQSCDEIARAPEL